MNEKIGSLFSCCRPDQKSDKLTIKISDIKEEAEDFAEFFNKPYEDNKIPTSSKESKPLNTKRTNNIEESKKNFPQITDSSSNLNNSIVSITHSSSKVTHISNIKQKISNNLNLSDINNNKFMNQSPSKKQSIINYNSPDKKISDKSNDTKDNEKKELINLVFKEVKTENIITDIEVQESPTLILEEFEGSIFSTKEKTIEICASGMIKGSLRNARDGVALFGINNMINTLPTSKSRKTDKETFKGAYSLLESKRTLTMQTVDYCLNIENYKNFSNILFRIFWDKNNKKYYLSSEAYENDNILVFYKIENDIKILRKNIVSLGEIIITFDIDSNLTLMIQVICNNEIQQSRLFKKDYSSLIKIGRSNNNEIPLASSSFSRIQMCVYYDSKGYWVLKDGNENNKSKNGTWIFLNEQVEIDKLVFFRIGTSFFRIKKIIN